MPTNNTSTLFHIPDPEERQKIISDRLGNDQPLSDKDFRYVACGFIASLRTEFTGVMAYLTMLLNGDFGDLSAEQSKMLNDLFKSVSPKLKEVEELIMLEKLKENTENNSNAQPSTQSSETSCEDEQRIAALPHVLPPYVISVAHIVTKQIVGITVGGSTYKDKQNKDPLKNDEETIIFLRIIWFCLHVSARRVFGLLRRQDNDYINKTYQEFVISLTKAGIIPNLVTENDFVQNAEQWNVDLFPIPESAGPNGLLEVVAKKITEGISRFDSLYFRMGVCTLLFYPLGLIVEVFNNPTNPKVMEKK